MLLIDEIDALVGDTLISVLRQFRAGYASRPAPFPQSVVPGAAEPGTPARRYVVECKILRGGLDATIREGLEQTLACMDRCRGESGHLVIFDRDASKPWEEKLYRRQESLDGRPVTVWGA